MRLRQLVFAARDLQPDADRLAAVLDLEAPYADPGVAEFGLHNAVYTFGDQFIEIVAPTRSGTAAGRLLDKRGAGGYMLILQTDDFEAARRRLDALGVRRVWATEWPDIRAMHLHPKDIGGTIVSIDQPEPAASWRWGGPHWRVQPGRAGAERLLGVTLSAEQPAAMAQRWAEVLGLASPAARGGTERLALDGGWIDFVPAEERGAAIVGCTLAVTDRAAVLERARAAGLPRHDGGFVLMGTRVDLQGP